MAPGSVRHRQARHHLGKVDRKRKIPVTVLLSGGHGVDGLDDVPLVEGSDEELALFAEVDIDPEHPFIQSTLAHDLTKNAEEALQEFYRRMRPATRPRSTTPALISRGCCLALAGMTWAA